jgi:hypothetical protein
VVISLGRVLMRREEAAGRVRVELVETSDEVSLKAHVLSDRLQHLAVNRVEVESKGVRL